MSTPATYTDENPTGCCPKFNYTERDGLTLEWKDKLFVKDYTKSFFYMPLNMKKIMNRIWDTIKGAKAEPETKDRMMLSHDLSPWKCEHYFSVTKEVPDAENVKLSGTFLTKLFE